MYECTNVRIRPPPSLFPGGLGSFPLELSKGSLFPGSSASRFDGRLYGRLAPVRGQDPLVVECRAKVAHSSAFCARWRLHGADPGPHAQPGASLGLGGSWILGSPDLAVQPTMAQGTHGGLQRLERLATPGTFDKAPRVRDQVTTMPGAPTTAMEDERTMVSSTRCRLNVSFERWRGRGPPRRHTESAQTVPRPLRAEQALAGRAAFWARLAFFLLQHCTVIRA
ncbi:hypothetical protein F4780DRAFT_242216 [Xylariomycetidae sp. FL0641]|nr:hypothetical protein F4780DRAFT_242216 [Xylariomycetidae sp. FL0641]